MLHARSYAASAARTTSDTIVLAECAFHTSHQLQNDNAVEDIAPPTLLASPYDLSNQWRSFHHAYKLLTAYGLYCVVIRRFWLHGITHDGNTALTVNQLLHFAQEVAAAGIVTPPLVLQSLDDAIYYRRQQSFKTRRYSRQDTASGARHDYFIEKLRQIRVALAFIAVWTSANFAISYRIPVHQLVDRAVHLNHKSTESKRPGENDVCARSVQSNACCFHMRCLVSLPVVWEDVPSAYRSKENQQKAFDPGYSAPRQPTKMFVRNQTQEHRWNGHKLQYDLKMGELPEHDLPNVKFRENLLADSNLIHPLSSHAEKVAWIAKTMLMVRYDAAGIARPTFRDQPEGSPRLISTEGETIPEAHDHPAYGMLTQVTAPITTSTAAGDGPTQKEGSGEEGLQEGRQEGYSEDGAWILGVPFLAL